MTLPLRNKIPIRRPVPTHKPKTDWREHKDDLRVDFNRRCGYCDTFDGFRNAFYEIDHFVPRSFFLTIGPTQYSNLVYSCRYCNNNKRAKWPSKSETIHNDGKQGFIDPCSADLDEHLYRLKDGSIMWKTDLGKWMFQEAFKFDERQKALKILWTLDRLRVIIKILNNIARKLPEGSPDRRQIMAQVSKYGHQYATFHIDLMDCN